MSFGLRCEGGLVDGSRLGQHAAFVCMRGRVAAIRQNLERAVLAVCEIPFIVLRVAERVRHLLPAVSSKAECLPPLLWESVKRSPESVSVPDSSSHTRSRRQMSHLALPRQGILTSLLLRLGARALAAQRSAELPELRDPRAGVHCCIV